MTASMPCSDEPRLPLPLSVLLTTAATGLW